MVVVALLVHLRKYLQVSAFLYFLKCTNKATTTIPNPILGEVPACKSCADFYKRQS